MKITEVIKYEGDNSTFIWKHPSEDFNTLSQLIVHESQEAILVLNGQALDAFGPGRYTLNTQNIPLLRRLVNLPTGGESPFHCEVYFINMVEQMAIKWGTDSKVQYIEPQYGFPISIGASGEMSLRVEDSRRLLLKLVGTTKELSQAALTTYFRGILMTHVKAYLAEIMRTNNICVFQVDELLLNLSAALKQRLTPDFLNYGVSLERFYISQIVKPDGEETYERFKKIFFEESIGLREEALQQKRELIRQETASKKIVMESAAIAQKRVQEGYNYQQERGFDVAEKAAQNEGAGNFSAAGVGLGMMGGVAAGMGSTVAGLTAEAIRPISGGAFQPVENAPAGSGPVTGFDAAPPMPGRKDDKAAGTAEDGSAPAGDPMAAFQQRVEKLKLLRGLIPEEEYAQKLKQLMDEI